MAEKTKERYHLLDTIRGITLISMIAYHASWDLVYIAGVNWHWYMSRQAFYWQQSICWTFILLSGFCMVFSRHWLKRGLTVFAGGALVTLVTLAVLPQDRVVFGVLTFLGTAMLLAGALEGVLDRIPPAAGVAASALLFALCRNINRGYLGFGRIRLMLPGTLYRNLLTAFFGFPAPEFFSTDYFSLLPWIFLFFCGCFAGRLALKKGWLKHPCMYYNIPVLSLPGRHSLLIYLVHQPVIYLVFAIAENVR